MDQPSLVPPSTADYYEVLGLSQSATTAEIKSAFRDLAKIHHPDKKDAADRGDASQFLKIREASECLTDPPRRASYDFRYARVRQEWAAYKSRVQQDETARGRSEETREMEWRRLWAAAEKRQREQEAQRVQRRKEFLKRVVAERAAKQDAVQREKAKVNRMVRARHEKSRKQRRKPGSTGKFSFDKLSTGYEEPRGGGFAEPKLPERWFEGAS